MTPIRTDDKYYSRLLDMAVELEMDNRPLLALALLTTVRASTEFPHSALKPFLNGIVDMLETMRRLFSISGWTSPDLDKRCYTEFER